MFTDTDTAKHNQLNKRQHMTVTTSNTQDTICCCCCCRHHLGQSITCRAFVLMTISVTSLHGAQCIGRVISWRRVGEAVIFKVAFLEATHAHWPLFHTNNTVFYTVLKCYKHIDLHSKYRKTTPTKPPHDNYLYTYTNKAVLV